MGAMGLHRKLKIIAVLFFFAFIGYLGGSFTYLLWLPGEIRLTEFSTHRLNMNLPLSATFRGDSAAFAARQHPAYFAALAAPGL